MALPMASCRKPQQVLVSLCFAGVAMSVTVPSSLDTVRVVPGLRHPEVAGVRVEVNGQVLSRGGNLWADQLVDTTATGAYNT